MSEQPKQKPPLKKRASGDHPVVQMYRKKLQSISEGTMPQLEALNRRLDRLKGSSERAPRADPRREPSEDERAEDEIPVDVVVAIDEDSTPTVPDRGRKKG